MRIWAACAADGECVGQNKGMQSAGVSAAKGDDRVNEGVVNSKQVLKRGGKLLHARNSTSTHVIQARRVWGECVQGA